MAVHVASARADPTRMSLVLMVDSRCMSLSNSGAYDSPASRPCRAMSRNHLQHSLVGATKTRAAQFPRHDDAHRSWISRGCTRRASHALRARKRRIGSQARALFVFWTADTKPSCGHSSRESSGALRALPHHSQLGGTGGYFCAIRRSRHSRSRSSLSSIHPTVTQTVLQRALACGQALSLRAMERR
jgi:hypothetical protein